MMIRFVLPLTLLLLIAIGTLLVLGLRRKQASLVAAALVLAAALVALWLLLGRFITAM
jgi:hypothetical protein